MKKLLFFLESLSGGGAEKVLSDIVSNLDRCQYEITVYTVVDGGVYEEIVSHNCTYRSFLHKTDYEAGGIQRLKFRLAYYLVYHLPANVAYKLFIKGKYDVEVAFIEGFATKLIAASPNTGSRKLAWVHIDMKRNPYADDSYKNMQEQCTTYKKYDKILCVSSSVKEAFEDKFFASEVVAVQYNPVDDVNIRKKSRELIEVERPSGILLGTVGRLEHQKGYLRLARCVKALKDCGYAFCIWIVGQGSQKDELERYIESNHLQDYIRLWGFQKNPYKYMERCDAFICSSYAEGFSTAATESLILGEPIFTVECAGMRELFGDAKCGEIVENTDEALLALLERIVSKEIDLDEYIPGVRSRARDFRIETRMKEIEGLLAD